MTKKARPAARLPMQQIAAPQARRKGMTLLWIGTILALLLPWIFPTLIVFCLGMVPTLVALIIDRTEQKYATLSVGSLNFAGVFPYLLKLWTLPQSFESAANIVTSVFSLVVMYGAAAFGWMVFIAVPPVVIAFLVVMAQRRVAVLRANQRKIVEEWGESVARPEAE